MIKTFTSGNLSELSKSATEKSRRRANLNVHTSADANVQRLFIATEPDTYIRPHRHPQSNKWEFFTILEGKMDLLIFDDEGNVLQRVSLSNDSARAVEIPPNVWHSYVCKTPGTVALEIKEGAYIPVSKEDVSPWSPAEGTEESKTYLDWMRTTK